MSSSRGKKAAVPASKKRNDASSSMGPITEIRHPLLQLPRGPQEELFQILQARPLIAGHCIDWATIEQVQLADAIRTLLTNDPWELFFGIIEPAYLKLTMELCSTPPAKHPEFGAALAYIQRSSKRRMTYMLSTATCSQSPHPSFSFTMLGRASTREVREYQCHQHSRGLLLMVHVARAHHRPCLFHRPRDSAPDGAASEGGHLHWPLRDPVGSILRAPQHRGPRIIPYPHQPDDIPDDVPPQHEDPPTQPPPPSHPVHATASYADISECLTRFEQQCFQHFDNIDATLQQIFQHLHISSPVPPSEPSSDEDDLWTNEPLRPPEYPPPLSNRLLSKPPV
ncbi:hypothetical protein GOBAR_AA04256 [Gossypium barbadense]|uniref:Uncharacterized protein n=1 Tax=Gossypium barbadense TaxID=3634 RepID=A0A2P5YL36_GOSBA|nr:hypothetical protein GOBAR_AA04256 [Gossypium barbadense]